MIDSQISMGKAPIGVAEVAAHRNIPVIALAGGIKQKNYLWNEYSLSACFSVVNKPTSLEEAMDGNVTYENLVFTTFQIFSLLKSIGWKKK